MGRHSAILLFWLVEGWLLSQGCRGCPDLYSSSPAVTSGYNDCADSCQASCSIS